VASGGVSVSDAYTPGPQLPIWVKWRNDFIADVAKRAGVDFAAAKAVIKILEQDGWSDGELESYDE
jgi:biotin-(acetyl-CoA carboxylase) ligase